MGADHKLAAQGDELAADPEDRKAMVLAEVGDGLVIRHQAARQPHDFHVASSFPFQPPARLNPVERAVDMELQQNRGMIGRKAGRLRFDPAKAQAAQIKLIDKGIDHPNRIVFSDPLVKPLGKQRAWPAINALNKSLHQILPIKGRENHSTVSVFTQSGPGADLDDLC